MNITDNFLRYLPLNIKNSIKNYFNANLDIYEIRLRANRPLIVAGNDTVMLKADGRATASINNAYIVTPEDCKVFFRNITGFSMYAFEQQLSQLFITLEGGIRIGLTGTASIENNKIKLVRDCMSFNIRIPHEIRGCSNNIIRQIINKSEVLNTLILSPPGAGKTTMLRDIARQLSDGLVSKPFNICIADERSEIASCYNGLPQFDVGIRTDVLDNCQKAEGIRKLIRVMAPDVIITDEIGGAEDTAALADAANSGVSIIASAHAHGLDDVLERLELKYVFESNIFERFIILSKRCGPGTVEGIYDRKKVQLIHNETGRRIAL